MVISDVQTRLVTLVLLAGVALTFQASAQTAKTIAEEYDKAIKAAETITAFGPDLFGEAVNLKDGSTSFKATDLSVRTNSGLPVSIGRSYGVNSADVNEYVDLAANGELFGNWKLDVPYMSGVYDERTGWVTTMPNPQQRCSVNAWSNSGPPAVTSLPSGWNRTYYPEDYWGGSNINIPGKGQYPLLYLPSTHTRPTDGNTYYWTTKGDFRVRCMPSLKNGSGEGFLVVLPDGTKYTFDWLSSRKVAALKGTNCNVNYGCPGEQVVINRREYFLHATKVEDRFGNSVVYDYDPAFPRRLRSVTSNDGVVVNLSYGTNGKITSISPAGRTWQYQYTSADNGILAAVVLPDASRWTFQYNNIHQILHYENQKVKWVDCEPAIFGTGTASMTVGHPSGAQGVFTFQNKLHGTDRTPGVCSVPNPDKPLEANLSSTLMVYRATSLLSKEVTGPGLAAQTWLYTYQPSWSWNPNGYSDNCTAPYLACNGTSSTDVTAPDGTITRSVFGNDYYRNAGQLYSVQVISGNTTLQTTTNKYMHDAANQLYPDRLGWDPNPRSNKLETEKLRPQRASSVVRDGVTLTSQVEICNAAEYCFDSYARPTKTRKYSSLGASRTDITSYVDNTNLWVMGQVGSRTNVDTGMTEALTEFDVLARPWKTYAFGKLQGTLAYNTSGMLATITDGRNNIVTVSNWKRGIPQSIQHPATPESPSGATESAVVNDNGWITSATNEIGAKTCYGYDPMGRMASIFYPSETQTGVCDASRWSPVSLSFVQVNSDEHGLPAGHWRASRYEGNKHVITYYDAMWRPVLEEVLDVSNVAGTLSQVVKKYDMSGRLSFQSYPNINVGNYWDITQGSRTFYDALDRVTRVEQDSEHGVLATTTEYLAGLQTRVVNPRGLATVTGFMAWDQPTYDLPIASVQPEGKVIEIARHPQFGWPLQLKQRSADNTLQQTRHYVYDGNAQLCKTIEPETGATVTGYDAANNPVWSASGLIGGGYASTSDCSYVAANTSGRVVNRTYDARNRIATLSFPDGLGNHFWAYEKDGLPTSITTYNGANNTVPVVNYYTYNQRRMLAGESSHQPGWYTWGLGYDYDSIGNLRWQSYPDSLTVDYAPNALGQPTQVRDQFNTAYAIGAQYYPNGALKQFTYGNGVTHSTTQNARQLPLRVTSSGGVLDYEYYYDANGNPTHIADALVPGYNPQDRWMSYDGLDRLTDVGAAMFGGDHWHRFSYDALDNLKSWKLAGVKDYADYVYEAQTNRLTSIRNTAGSTVMGIGYDPQGNLQNKNGQTYEFDYGNRLRGVTGKEYYRYDGLGRRVMNWRNAENTVTVSQYSQSGQLMYQEESGKPASNHIYLGGSLIATRENTWGVGVAIKYQHTDALGSPVAVTNQAGIVIERNDYEPYGAIIGKPNKSGIGYTGHMMDGATGLTYMQHRYYDQSIGRFLSVDPVTANASTGAMFNRYKYAANNSYRFVDPDGRQEMAAERFNDAFAEDPDAFEAFEPAAVAVTIAAVALTPVVGPSAAATLRTAVKSSPERPTVAGVQVGKTPSETRKALEQAGHAGQQVSNKAGTETGTLHNVPSMKMDVRVMNGGPKHSPRVVTTAQGTRQPVNPANGKNFGNIPKAQQLDKSHILLKPDKIP